MSSQINQLGKGWVAGWVSQFLVPICFVIPLANGLLRILVYLGHSKLSNTLHYPVQSMGALTESTTTYFEYPKPIAHQWS
jgi:hypothetical protein